MTTNGKYDAVRKVYQYVYKPLPDITVYELAVIIPVFTSVTMIGSNVNEIIESLPDEARRHFEVKE